MHFDTPLVLKSGSTVKVVCPICKKPGVAYKDPGVKVNISIEEDEGEH